MEWSSPPLELRLLANEVHVWRVKLDQLIEQVPLLEPLLSTEEQVRAKRFRFDLHRSRFIVSRGYLRKILACYLNLQPDQITFGYRARGKPFLAMSTEISFNVSHSAGLALYAIAPHRQVGIDVEQVRAIAATEIANRFFAPSEQATLQSQAPDQQQATFFRYWTCKEAYLKATGEGLAQALDQIEISLNLEAPAQLLKIAGDPQIAKQWAIQELIPDAGYVGAIAVEGTDWHPVFWDGSGLGGT
ncbi:MAG: 4'-phosphopantetheinyl transferase superfamily protein [Leptolyngbyaceae bacterium]|nr:4'-phosphopantetheinyl transferase superfamily protein [Leptolyngbyaceae bacterium]